MTTPYGRAHRRNRQQWANTQDLRCWLCGDPINPDLPRADPMHYQLDHIKPVSTHPELANDPANTRPAHAQCNNSRGNRAPTPGLTRNSRDWTTPRKPKGETK